MSSQKKSGTPIKARYHSFWIFLIGIIIGSFLLEEGFLLLTPQIANYFGMAWPGGVPDHISYAGQTYTQPSPCLLQSQVSQEALVQVGQIPTLLGDDHPLFVPHAQWNSQTAAKEAYLQTEAGCYIRYELAGHSS